ncbi:MAG: hypothetical protein HY741_04235 [Chloroflexi bacterium]|nr:hypothetical protein [Chloroflexota bacterium]
MAAQLYAELQEIRTLLIQVQMEVERLTRQLNQELEQPKTYTLSSLVGLGASGLTDVSERHDEYVGEAILNEYIR